MRNKRLEVHRALLTCAAQNSLLWAILEQEPGDDAAPARDRSPGELASLKAQCDLLYARIGEYVATRDGLRAGTADAAGTPGPRPQ